MVFNYWWQIFGLQIARARLNSSLWNFPPLISESESYFISILNSWVTTLEYSSLINFIVPYELVVCFIETVCKARCFQRLAFTRRMRDEKEMRVRSEFRVMSRTKFAIELTDMQCNPYRRPSGIY